MNKREKIISEKYKKEGWKVIRGGSPDFLLLKKGKSGINDMVIEVKAPSDRLSAQQNHFIKFLKRHGVKCKIVKVHLNYKIQKKTPGKNTLIFLTKEAYKRIWKISKITELSIKDLASSLIMDSDWPEELDKIGKRQIKNIKKIVNG